MRPSIIAACAEHATLRFAEFAIVRRALTCPGVSAFTPLATDAWTPWIGSLGQSADLAPQPKCFNLTPKSPDCRESLYPLVLDCPWIALDYPWITEVIA